MSYSDVNEREDVWDMLTMAMVLEGSVGDDTPTFRTPSGWEGTGPFTQPVWLLLRITQYPGATITGFNGNTFECRYGIGFDGEKGARWVCLPQKTRHPVEVLREMLEGAQ